MEISKELNDKLRKILESANDVIFDVYHIQDYSDSPQDIEEHVTKIRNAGKKIETAATKLLKEMEDKNKDETEPSNYTLL